MTRAGATSPVAQQGLAATLGFPARPANTGPKVAPDLLAEFEENRIMKLINAAFVLGVILNLMTPVAFAAEPALRDQLSISVTNRYGDVFTNLVVAKILGDGLVLEHKAGQLKVKYADLPQDLREKYQPLAAAAENREKEDAAANAAFLAVQRRMQVEQARLRAAQEKQQPRQQPATAGKLRIEIPRQGWGITVLNAGLRELGKMDLTFRFSWKTQRAAVWEIATCSIITGPGPAAIQ